MKLLRKEEFPSRVKNMHQLQLDDAKVFLFRFPLFVKFEILEYNSNAAFYTNRNSKDRYYTFEYNSNINIFECHPNSNIRLEYCNIQRTHVKFNDSCFRILNDSDILNLIWSMPIGSFERNVHPLGSQWWLPWKSSFRLNLTAIIYECRNALAWSILIQTKMSMVRR